MQSLKLIHYRNGTYQGQIKSNKRNGKGILITDNGQIIVGNWKNDKLYGQGLVFVNSGQYSYGQYNRGDLQGWSKYQSIDKILISQFNSNRTINKQILIDKNQFTYKVTAPAQNSIYQLLKQQQLPQTFIDQEQNNKLNIQQLVVSQLNAKLPFNANYTLTEYLTECYKDDQVFETQILINGYLMFRIKDQSSVVGLGFVINKNHQLVSYGNYIGSKLNGYGCKYQNTVRYQGIFQNGFLNGFGLKFISGKYSYGIFENGNLVNPIYLQQRSLASQQKLHQLKKTTHITNLNFTNIYLSLNMIKFKGTSQIIFQISLKQQYIFNKLVTNSILSTSSPNKKPNNIINKLIANKQQNDIKSSVSIMTNKKFNNNQFGNLNNSQVNINQDQSRISDIGKSISVAGSQRRFGKN